MLEFGDGVLIGQTCKRIYDVGTQPRVNESRCQSGRQGAVLSPAGEVADAFVTWTNTNEAIEYRFI